MRSPARVLRDCPVRPHPLLRTHRRHALDYSKSATARLSQLGPDLQVLVSSDGRPVFVLPLSHAFCPYVSRGSGAVLALTVHEPIGPEDVVSPLICRPFSRVCSTPLDANRARAASHSTLDLQCKTDTQMRRSIRKSPCTVSGAPRFIDFPTHPQSSAAPC